MPPPLQNDSCSKQVKSLQVSDKGAAWSELEGISDISSPYYCAFTKWVVQNSFIELRVSVRGFNYEHYYYGHYVTDFRENGYEYHTTGGTFSSPILINTKRIARNIWLNNDN
jgi:hypothetical protein